MTVKGLGLVLYGSEGIGKTSLALQFANVGPLTCLSVNEYGYSNLEITGEVLPNSKNIQITNWEKLIYHTKEFKDKVLVIDSLSGIQTILFDYVCRTAYNGIWAGKDGFSSYWKGQRVDSPPVLIDYLDQLERLRDRGCHVILTGHMVTTEETNTLGADYLSHVLDMDQGDKGGVRSCIMKWAQAVLFMNIDVSITRATELARDKTVLEGKAKDDDKRLMYTTKSPGHAAKNCLKLPPIINMGESPQEAFKAFWSTLPQVYKDSI